jgi:hypothetical protein
MLTEVVEGVMTVQLLILNLDTGNRRVVHSDRFTSGKQLPLSIEQDACMCV